MSSTFDISKVTPVVEKKKQNQHEEERHPATEPLGCGLLGRYPVLSVLLCASIGIGIGIGLSYWDPESSDDQHTKDVVLKWIGLVGDLFIRGLKCVILPLVFINVTVSVIDMMNVGKAGSIGWKTIALYLVTTVLAATAGILSILCFQGFFKEGTFEDSPPATISLGCNSEDGTYLTEFDNGTVACTANYEDATDTMFYVTDVTNSFEMKSKGVPDISMSDTVYHGVFTKLVASNITDAFADANFAAIVFFAVVFGVAISRVMDRFKVDGEEQKSFIMDFFKELDAVFLTMINWLIAITPLAVLSLIIKAVGSQERLADSFSNVGFLVVATIVAKIGHFIIVQCGLFYVITRSSPFGFLKHIIPAQTMAFACASSAATIPMTLKCVKSSGRVPDAVSRFVVPLGATVNMDGSAIYFPCACIWLARLNGIEPDIASYILLVILSTIGSAGAAPVPSAGLVLIITAYNTVFNTTGTPEGFTFILAIDWFMDRLRTVLNVTGDTFVSAMVASLCPIDETLESSDIESSDSDEVEELEQN